MSDYFGQAADISTVPTPATPVAIASSTNATPIVVTTAAPHLLETGMVTVIANHLVNTAANGRWKANVLSSTTFQLKTLAGANSVGNGIGAGTGTSRSLALPGIELPEDAVTDLDAASVNVPFEAHADSLAFIAMKVLGNPLIAEFPGSRMRTIPGVEIGGILAAGGTTSGTFVIPQGALLTSVSFYIAPDAHGAWPPASLATLQFAGINVITGGSVGLATGSDTAANLAAGDLRRAITVSGAPLATMDRTAHAYTYLFTNESGANAESCTIGGVIVTYTTIGIDDGY